MGGSSVCAGTSLNAKLTPNLFSDRYLLYAPLTHQQKELYEAIVGKSIRSLLIDRKTSGSSNAGSSREATPLSTPSSPGGSVGSGNTTSTKPASRRSKRKSYLEKSDEQFFDDLDNGELDQEAEEDDDLKQRGQAYERKRAGAFLERYKGRLGRSPFHH